MGALHLGTQGQLDPKLGISLVPSGHANEHCDGDGDEGADRRNIPATEVHGHQVADSQRANFHHALLWASTWFEPRHDKQSRKIRLAQVLARATTLDTGITREGVRISHVRDELCRERIAICAGVCVAIAHANANDPRLTGRYDGGSQSRGCVRAGDSAAAVGRRNNSAGVVRHLPRDAIPPGMVAPT